LLNFLDGTPEIIAYGVPVGLDCQEISLIAIHCPIELKCGVSKIEKLSEASPE
jgi:hypothetical protein